MKTPAEFEKAIQRELNGQKLDSALLALRAVSESLDPFVAAGISLFCVRFSRSLGGGEQPNERMGIRKFRRIHDLVKSYLICDPLGYDAGTQAKYLETNPVFTILRIYANQASFAPELLGHFARSSILFDDCVQLLKGSTNVPNFDFGSKFYESNGADINDYIKVCYVAFAASASNNQLGFSSSYFEKARSTGLSIPAPNIVSDVLASISSSSANFLKLYREKRRRNRLYAAYDYNPVFRYPLIRPWREGRHWNRMISPVPALVAHRACTGIYYQMREDYGTSFTMYFGSLLEKYVGIVLEQCKHQSISLLSEGEVRPKYSARQGKCPDWIVIEGDTAILLECKATNFRPDALATGEEEAINLSLRQVEKGLKQLHEFVSACQSGLVNIPLLNQCTKFHLAIVTFEPLHLVNSTLFQEHINGLIESNIPSILPWHIIDVGQLERFQPHSVQGYSIASLFSMMESQGYQDIMAQIENETKRNFRDSFLYKREMDILKAIGATEERIAELSAME